MKKLWKKAALLGAMLGLVWVLAGCGMNNSVEDMFALPRIPDEYTGLSQQIEELVAQGYEYAPPTIGQNIQAVQMEDLNGDGIQEALVFFRKSGDEKPLKILVFEKLGESYELLCTVESSGNSIDCVYYEDLTGDGRNELVVGWKISSTVQSVAVYNIGREAIPLMSSGYTRFVVQELNSYDPPGLFVMRSDSDGAPVAEVYTWQTNILAVSYRCGLSSTMSDLARGSVVKGTLTGGKPAVFITGVNDNGNAVTDILAWENTGAVVNVAVDESTGKTNFMIVVAEGCVSAMKVGDQIKNELGLDPRVTILGHIQRGGSPTAKDRVIATRMGYEAVRVLAEGGTNRVIVIHSDQVSDLDIDEGLAMMKTLNQEEFQVMKTMTGQ